MRIIHWFYWLGARLIIVALTHGVIACSTTGVIQIRETQLGTSYNDDRNLAQDRGSSIHLRNGDVLKASDIRINRDSVQWMDSGTLRGIPLDSVERITGVNRFFGGLEGYGLGLVGGIGAGAVAGEISDNGDHYLIPGWFVGAVLGGVVGSTVGLISGVIVGHRYSFTIERDH